MKTTVYNIENEALKKELLIEKNRIKGFKLYNKLNGAVLATASGSEEFVLSFGKGLFTSKVKASDLKIESLGSKEGKHEIKFSTFKVKDSLLRLSLIYEEGDRHYFKKHIELSFEKSGEKNIFLDYIAFERLSFDPSLSYWTVPKQADSHIPGFSLSLGQPVYIGSFFFGCEFPVALTRIEKNVAESKYYSGKEIRTLLKKGSFISENYVAGAAESDQMSSVQKALFKYIKDISKPVRLRRQYNSWYDHMLDISEKNLTESFLEIDKGLTKAGEPPLDSFVADDGWNDYTKGFWSFNEKFPKELYPFSRLTEAFGSNFGLWLGPRGGYTNDTIKFAKKVEQSGNGFVNKRSIDICVASEKYTEKTAALLSDYQNRFNLNYWKLDGFSRMSCRNKAHDHMTGGYKDMYFYTDCWERWIEVFNSLQKNGMDNYWINLTCYAWPSPWFLRYVNSLWMQISDDVGFIGDKKTASDKDRMLSYRDEKYFDFYNVRQFQFPQRGLYNHDPIYGNTAKVNMTDEEFRSYLFTMAARGNCFWELYYSYNMMNEAKWRINYAVMRFLEDNIDLLSNSIIFGSRPSLNQVYGYSCFSDYEGMVCLRNPSEKEKDYELKLDEKIGVPKSLVPVEAYTVLPYTPEPKGEAYGYGDSVKVKLMPFETIILHFGKERKALGYTYCSAIDNKTLEITFNQTVNIKDVFSADNPIVASELLEDYMTLRLSFEKPFERMNNLTLNGVKDIMGNSTDVAVSFDYYEGGIITEGLYGNSGFTVKATLTKEAKGVLYSQGEEVLLSVSEEHILFKVGLSSVVSYENIENVAQVTAVRERNGTLKLYLNGKLDSGVKTENAFLSGAKGEKYSDNMVVLYNKAFSYDEV